ncbi:MAG: DUF4929 family protein [Prevotella sp.]|nr:DUF4929 family protein [Prevotella sp.]
MKKMMFAFIGMMSLMLIACGDDDNGGGSTIKNFWTLTKESKTLYDNDTEGVELTVTLAYTAEESITLVPTVSGDAEYLNAFELSTSAVVIEKGQKTASFRVRAKENKVISKNGSLTVGFEALSALNGGEAITVSVAPKIDVELTAEQLQLVQKWQEAYGIDVRQFIGSLAVKTTITFGDDDKDQFNNGENTVVYESDVTAVTISENATDDKIVLKMLTNPLGMTTFIRDMYAAVTINDEEYWQQNPYAQALLPLVQDKIDMGAFMVSLDNIVINPEKKTIEFIGKNDEEIAIIPFEYDYPAWNALKQMAEEGKTVSVNEGDTDAEYEVSELIESDGTLDPYYYLGNTDVTEDEYGGTNFVEPSAAFDAGNMTFNFSWDFGAGGWLYDYVKVSVTYTLNQ